MDDLVEEYYREYIAQELEEMMMRENQGTDYDETIKWFNQGIKYAIMMVRFGVLKD
jgi:hypothetical protein